MKVASLAVCVALTLATVAGKPQSYGPPPATGGPAGGYGGGGGLGGASAPANYQFQWDVNDPASGNFYGHGEQRDGDNTQGSYYVDLPDSRKMRVEYRADQGGYFPTVTFEGEAQFPAGGGGGGGGSGYGAPPPPSGSYGAPSGKRK
ncbi:hypothetical protein Pcinc_000912 [Petrolisthes cinctipes]|uniref:Pro-resilin n=1 Tax=Petrolisthes cinctipes TaxID=88211 RepID=A0AAE1GPB3_PETCI|nr:hypothetical protein Pcinc_011583 [Petrolisthes cinctipes]KAK3895384.1 hypothetical protein Pcinc_000912 [Petrolisthes cinctipes]